MKTILRYLWRDKVDLIMFILTIAAVVQVGFIGKDLTPGFAVLALYCFGVMHRIGTFTDIIKEKNADISDLINEVTRLNNHIFDLINTKKTK